MKRTFAILLSILLLSTVTCEASWLIFHKPEFRGKIVDIETHEPIEGAVVVAIYRKEEMSIADSVDIDIDAREALTDRNGDFVIPSYTTFINPLSWSIPVQFIIFKPGYICNTPISLEDEFSGSGKRPDRDISASWNGSLQYRILKSGVVMLRKVNGKDRIESFDKASRIESLQQKFNKKLKSTSMIDEEYKIIRKLEKTVER